MTWDRNVHFVVFTSERLVPCHELRPPYCLTKIPESTYALTDDSVYYWDHDTSRWVPAETPIDPHWLTPRPTPLPAQHGFVDTRPTLNPT